jgi:hypothetical protein
MKLDKTEIARRQLGTALALFLDDADPVSVHTLACAGAEIGKHLTIKANAEPFSTHALATFPTLDIAKLKRIRNQYWNAFKHATTRDGLDRADEELLERFTDEVNDHALFVGWYDYALATARMPLETQVFHVWYFARYPDKLNPEANSTEFQSVFPNLASLSRSDQKRALREVIAKYRGDPEIVNHPQTDARPLVLGTDGGIDRAAGPLQTTAVTTPSPSG